MPPKGWEQEEDDFCCSFDVQGCFYWCYHLFHDTVSPNTKTLPDEIIIDILTRLPAQRVQWFRDKSSSLSISPSFITAYFNRAVPVIVFCYRFSDSKNEWIMTSGRNYVNFTDAMGKSTTTSAVVFGHPMYFDKAVFYCSCNGFIVLVARHIFVYIWNPITKQKINVEPPYRDFLFCGFYFHPATKGYRLIFQRLDKEFVPASFSFCVYDLVSKKKRIVATGVHHPPTMETSPTVVNEALHWIVNGISDCLHSIIVFNINSERFHTIPHSGDQCGLEKKHESMGLMEMEGKLALCDASLDKGYLSLWVMEDYEQKIWIKVHMIDIKPVMRFCGVRHSNSSDVYVGDFYMFNKELLFRVANRKLVLYNMESGSFRCVGESIRKAKDKDLRVLAVPHVYTLLKIPTHYLHRRKMLFTKTCIRELE